MSSSVKQSTMKRVCGESTRARKSRRPTRIDEPSSSTCPSIDDVEPSIESLTLSMDAYLFGSCNLDGPLSQERVEPVPQQAPYSVVPWPTSPPPNALDVLLPYSSDQMLLPVAPVEEPSTKVDVDLPRNYHQLGEHLLIGAHNFFDETKIHLRRYVLNEQQQQQQLRPTKSGITMSPSRWQLLSAALQTFPYRQPYASVLLEEDLFLSTVAEKGRVVAVNFQYAYSTQADTIQLSNTHLKVSIPQFEKLLDIREIVDDIVKKTVFRETFKKLVLSEVILSDESDMERTAAEKILTEGLVDMCRMEIVRIVETIPFFCRACVDFTDNQEGHSCHLANRLDKFFEKGFARMNIRGLAMVFANTGDHCARRYLDEQYLDTLDGLDIANKCRKQLFRMSCEL